MRNDNYCGVSLSSVLNILNSLFHLLFLTEYPRSIIMALVLEHLVNSSLNSLKATPDSYVFCLDSEKLQLGLKRQVITTLLCEQIGSTNCLANRIT